MLWTPDYCSPVTTGRPSPPSLPVAGSSGAVVQELVCASNKDLPLAGPKTVRIYQGELHTSELRAYAGSLYIGDCLGFEGPVRNDKARVRHFTLICPEVNWPDSAFSDVTIKGNIFTKAQMPNLKLKNVVFSGSDFSGANLSGATLKVVCVTHCDFRGANLTEIFCDRVNFSGSKLDNAQISFSQQCIEESLRTPTTGDLNCFAEHGIGNLVMCIDSIDSDYKEHKNRLMRSVIEPLLSMDDVALQRYLPRMEETLFNNLDYLEEPAVAQCVYRILGLFLESKNQNAIKRGELHPETKDGALHWSTALCVRYLIDNHPFSREKLKRMFPRAFGHLGLQ